MRAATALAPLLSAAAIAQVWRGDDVSQSPSAGVVPSGSNSLDAELPGGGWPQGALTEILVDAPGQGELSLLMPAIAQMTRTGRPCIWALPWGQLAPSVDTAANRAANDGAANDAALNDIPLPYAPALAAAGIDLDRTIFVQPATPREGLWALEQSLRMPHLGALIGWLPAGSSADADFRALRRLHLLASRYQALVFVLRTSQAAQAPSPAALRLQLGSRNGDLRDLTATVLKRRGRPLLDPITLQVHPARWKTAEVALADKPVIIPAQRAPRVEPALPERRWSLHAIFSH